MKVKSLSHVRLFATPWTVAYQAPPPMGFSRQEYWSGLLFSSPGDLPNPGIEPWSSALWADAFTIWATREVQVCVCVCTHLLGMSVCRCIATGTWWFNCNFSPVTRIIRQCLLSLSFSPVLANQKPNFSFCLSICHKIVVYACLCVSHLVSGIVIIVCLLST